MEEDLEEGHMGEEDSEILTMVMILEDLVEEEEDMEEDSVLIDLLLVLDLHSVGQSYSYSLFKSEHIEWISRGTHSIPIPNQTVTMQ